MSGLGAVPDSINFPNEEQKILKHWEKDETFKKSLELSKDRPHFTFYDGPPFATGLPHYGHILTGTIKDVVTRWAAQTGYYVERRFGWDTHGLPVEFEVDKTLGIKGPSDVHEMGIDVYNNHCRSIVMRYSNEWRHTVQRMGRWIDFDNDYKTLYPWFMESVWWVFSELYKKDMVYRGVKVMPFSTGCSTPLSNFEAGQNYKDVQDPAAFVGFQLKSNPNRSLIIWTTTPWTLPSNLAIAVHPDLEYVAVKPKGVEKEYVLLKCRLTELWKKADQYQIVDTFLGKTLGGLEYEPVFPYFAYRRESGAFKVLLGTFITTDQGTGCVHQAPYFGEIDYTTCLENNVITKDGELVCPVDEQGRFTSEVTDYKGIYVKDADKAILKHLQQTGHLVKQATVQHSYPFCWRSDTPLLYKAVPSWFIRVESIVSKLLENNDKTYWVPTFVKEKRFANWLRDARDWAVSRNRFWGTPINLWVSEDMSEVVCPSSIKELEELTGQKITDIHRESVDGLTIKSKSGKVLKRVSEVFDCWFESGSMPYAQQHYPFENKQRFEANFPADFIAEGIDQTRGWFYTLLVLSTALFDKPPFKNLICNGLVLAADGNKMSKRKKNYPDPLEVVGKYGADALRLYLINSPVVRGETLKFREEGVRDLLKDVFLPWFNAYRILASNLRLFELDTKAKFDFHTGKASNVMDRWIVSFTNSLVQYVRKEMELYHLYTVVTPLTKYFDTLTNIYIRLNRSRFKPENEDVEDCRIALSTLAHVLVTVVRLMAPFTPYFSEYLWKSLKIVIGSDKDSVHFCDIPEPHLDLIDDEVERRVSAMREVIDIARTLRERKGISTRYPLREVVVVNRSQQFLDDVLSLKTYIQSELNLKEVTVSQDKSKYGVQLKAEPNFKLLGKRLKGDQKKVAEYLKNTVTETELEDLISNCKITVHGYELTSEEVGVAFTCDSKSGGNWETQAGNQTVVLLDCTEDEALLEEGLSREIINRIQKLRKEAKLQPDDAASAYCTFEPAEGHLLKTAQKFLESISKSTGTTVKLNEKAGEKNVVASNKSEIRNEQIEVNLILGA
ncbi:unnamed protein product [Bursaphelenchus okinawaensis]|uniref:Isoleucine--tRNA ligase, cytoplasmic n=1 Tax=Bursaphelenchus okinawaensis TaxID=465554 RepID=A0A811KT86_9BILA|nr:unnamed protein product [Bursaphelenchus okinawaensis]CAG9111250.1 unnamed protein product [Bursaphelenchus okinawaensis]